MGEDWVGKRQKRRQRGERRGECGAAGQELGYPFPRQGFAALPRLDLALPLDMGPWRLRRLRYYRAP